MNIFKKPLTYIFLFGLVVRLVFLVQYPSGFSADEVNQGYSAYSILKTGNDEWGQFLPIAPRSYGDYRAPLYTYLTIPFVAIFGLNEFATRFPNALFGSLSILVIYFLVQELFNQKLGLRIGKKIFIPADDFSNLAAIVFAINPWSISLSRGAFEPNLPVFVVTLGWLLFEIAFRKKSTKYMLLSVLTFGFGLFSYYSARFFTPIFVLVLIIQKFIELRDVSLLRKFAFQGVIFFVFLFVATYTMFMGGGTRSGDVAIFNPTGGWGSISDKRYEAVLLGLPDGISRVFSNKVSYVFETFSTQYLSYFSPQFLFTNGAGEATYGMMPGRGLFYLVEMITIAIGLFVLLKNYKLLSGKIVVLGFWLFMSPVFAGLSKGPGFAANRSALMMVPLIIVSSLGVFVIIKYMSQYVGYKKSVFVLTVAISIFFLGFVEDYVYHAPIYNSRNMSFGVGEALKYVKTIESDYDEIIMDKSISEPQMFVSFYNLVDPRIVQEESKSWLKYETEGFKFVDQLGEYKLGKYVFKNIDNIYPRLGSSLYIVKYKSSLSDVNTLKTINYPDGKPALLIISVPNEIN